MKAFKHMTAFVLALVIAAALAVTAYAASVTVKYRVYVYSDEITFRQYDYSQSTTPSITNLTISATSGLGSGSALYHMKYADGAVAYCIEPGVHSDDSGTYREGSSASWYNLPASVQSGIALAMSLGYPSADYGAASGDRNSSAIINAEKWAATQAIIWELICEYRNAYTYDDWGYSPFYGCVDTSRYPTFELWYDEIAAAMQNATMIPSFAEYAPRWCDTIELRRNAAGSYYEAERYAVEFPRSDHQRLHDVLAQHRGFAMVSYNNCDYIRRLYEDFFIYEVERPNSQSKKKNDIYREYIMTNYDPRVFASQMTIFGDYSSDGKICRLVHIPERPLRT